MTQCANCGQHVKLALCNDCMTMVLPEDRASWEIENEQLKAELETMRACIRVALEDLENPQDVGLTDAIKWLREALGADSRGR